MVILAERDQRCVGNRNYILCGQMLLDGNGRLSRHADQWDSFERTIYLFEFSLHHARLLLVAHHQQLVSIKKQNRRHTPVIN